MNAIRRCYLKYQYTQTDYDRIVTNGDVAESQTKNSVTTTWKENTNHIIDPEQVLSVPNLFLFSISFLKCLNKP